MLLTAAIALLAAAAEPQVLSLSEALRQAQASQPSLRQAKSNVEAAKARVDQTHAPQLPQVNGQLGYARRTNNFAARNTIPAGNIEEPSADYLGYNSFNAGVNASLLLWDFGQSKARVEAAEAGVRTQERAAEDTRLEVDWQVRRTFFLARAQKALVEVAREAEVNQQRHVAQAEGLVARGKGPPIDVSQARQAKADASFQLVQAQGAYDTAKAQLLQAMGSHEPAAFEVADEEVAPVAGEDEADEVLLAEAVKNRPDLARIEQQIAQVQLQAKAQNAGRLPSIGASAGLTETGVGPTQLALNWNAGVALNWPLFTGGLQQAQVRESMANVDALQAQRDALVQQVRLSLAQARVAVRTAKGQQQLAAESLAFARERLKLAEGRYDAGAGSALEIFDAQLALTQSQGQQVNAQYQLALARAQLVRALGRP